MKFDPRSTLAAAALFLASCSGNFGTGTSMPGNALPPDGTQGVGTNSMPGANPSSTPAAQAQAKTAATPSPGVYPLSQAKAGFACPPTTDGYACVLQFNVPPPTPAPKSAKGKRTAAKASATSVPSPGESPSAVPGGSPAPSGAPSGADMGGMSGMAAGPSSPAPATPSPKPTATPPSATLTASALPKNAPPMAHTPANVLDVVPLMMVSVTTSASFPLDGDAVAQFTLPKSQIDGRGFALQLFAETTHKKHHAYKPIWTFNRSNIEKGALIFDYAPPKFTIAKGNTYVLVLYGDDKSRATPSRSTRSASPSPQPTATASVSPSATP